MQTLRTIFQQLIFFWCFRRLKGGSIEPHPSENALIINYTLEATVFNEPGDAMLEKSKVFIYMLCMTYLCFAVSSMFVFIGVTLILHIVNVLCVDLQWSYNNRINEHQRIE